MQYEEMQRQIVYGIRHACGACGAPLTAADLFYGRICACRRVASISKPHTYRAGPDGFTCTECPHGPGGCLGPNEPLALGIISRWTDHARAGREA